MDDFYSDLSLKDDFEKTLEKYLFILRYLEISFILSFSREQADLLWKELLRRIQCKILKIDVELQQIEDKFCKFKDDVKDLDLLKQKDEKKFNLIFHEFWDEFDDKENDLVCKMEMRIVYFFGDEQDKLLVVELNNKMIKKTCVLLDILQFEMEKYGAVLNNLYLLDKNIDDDSLKDDDKKHSKHL